MPEDTPRSSSRPGTDPAKRAHPSTGPAQDGGRAEYAVQFYEDVEYLAESVGEFLAGAFSVDEAVLVIATPENRVRIETKLAERGANLQHAEARGRYLALDAAETLASFVRNGAPDRARFMETIGGVVDELASDSSRVRVFGEMVVLLGREHGGEAACRLEELWNDLRAERPLALLCAYPIAELARDTSGHSFARICAAHDRVLPAESYAELGTSEERDRAVSDLQRRAVALEAEIARREGAERDLLDFLDHALEGVYSVAPDGTIVWANGAQLDLLGLEASDYVGRQAADFHVEPGALEDMMGRLMAGEDIVDRPATIRSDDGALKAVIVHARGHYEGQRLVRGRFFMRDVTESHEAERDRALLAAIIESSDDAIVSKDLEGIITSWNRGAERIFGYSAEEIVGQPVMVLLPEDRADEEPVILQRIRRGDRIDHYETVRRAKDGTLIDVSLTVSPIVDSSGRIVGASKIARDVTQRRRAEAQARRAEENYGRLAGLLPVGVFTCERPDGRISYYNAKATELWGRAPALGDPSDRFCGSLRMFRSDDMVELPHAQCPMAVALRDGRSFRNQEVVFERPDGSRITAMVNIDPVRDDDGRIVGAINVFHDVSAEKEAERALQAQKSHLQTLLATLPVAVFIANDPECRRVTPNRAGARLLRMPEHAEFSASDRAQGVPSHYRATRYGSPIPPGSLAIQRAAKGEVVHSDEIDVEFADGSVLHTLVSAQPLRDVSGELQGAVACVLDVTELKNSENALRDADRRKDEFLATLAHELRNPLAPIVAGLEVMEMAADDRETVERTRSAMARQADQLVTLVDDLLDVSRITRGKFELRKRKVDLEDIVQIATDASRLAIEKAGHEFVVELPDAPTSLEADPNRAAQILANMLNNAAKYTPPGGRITLAVDRRDDHVRISVTDTGIGIPQEMLGSIFEMFAQIDRPQERGHMGLGIGLTLTKSLVEMHRGTIEVQSAGVDRGSTFTVCLPSLSDESVLEAEDLDLADNGANPPRRILVVDDSDAMVDTLSIMMRLLGNEVRSATNGREAIDVACEFRPDVVLMDLGMPVMTGYEAARHIREQPWGADMRLIALTGWGQDEHKQRTLEAGFDQHLVKPVLAADLERLFSD